MLDSCNLSKVEVNKYGRQLIMNSFGLVGQQALKAAKLLIIGCGGLGCPAAIYLAGAGVGVIGLVDDDVVDDSNLHRQICHTECRVGHYKVDSLALSLKALNSLVSIETHCIRLTSDNAMDIISRYDIILDCTDNVVARYLINDCCVLAKKPLVSASALGFEGQLTIYNYMGSPCYRCIFPSPPPAYAVTNCNEGGVLGSVTGMLGSMQATEAIKIITNIGTTFSGRMFIYDAETSSMRTIRLRGRNISCAVCGDQPTITQPIDYEIFCQSSATDKCQTLKLLSSESRITMEEYNSIMAVGHPHLLVDVRPSSQTAICKFHHALELCMDELDSPDVLDRIRQSVKEVRFSHNISSDVPIYVLVICRRGNQSQVAVEQLSRLLRDDPIILKDIIGGMKAYSGFDADAPIY